MTLTVALATLCRLMPSDLPQTINPLRLARAGAKLHGRINIGEMERLGPLLKQPRGQVEFELSFHQDQDGISYVEGHASAQLAMLCQRCFEPMTVDVRTQTRLVVITSDEAAREIPDKYEPLLFTGDNQVLKNLIEEEMLLALPIAPLHPVDKCSVKPQRESIDDEGNNPFSVLKNIEL